MEIDKVTNKLEQADGFLTKLKELLKKHWGILSLLLVAYFFYWAFTTDFEEELPNEPKVEEVIPTGPMTAPYIIRTEYDINSNGETLYYYIWSDSVETLVN